MAISKKYREKYPEVIKALKLLKMEDYEIEQKICEMEDMEGKKAITFEELKNMSEENRKKLYSYCWKEGRPRCSCTGISDVIFTKHPRSSGGSYWTLGYSDGNGEPHFEFDDWKEKIDKVGDGYWDYGLYRVIKKKSHATNS